MVAAITLVLLAMVALFAFGIFAVVFFLRLYDKVFPEKKSEREDEREEASRR